MKVRNAKFGVRIKQERNVEVIGFMSFLMSILLSVLLSATMVAAMVVAADITVVDYPVPQESIDAQRLNRVNLFDLGLEGLSKIQVTVASHKPETIVETASIVSRYSVAQMQELGLNSLREMLSYIPGVTVQDHLDGQTFISIRGVYEGFNQKVLFLLDDTPYFMPSHSDIPLFGIPLEAISHIEVIRGPGAVYYGTNATAGVIKVVTKKATNNQLSVRFGENNFINANGVYQQSTAENNFLLAAELQRDDGYSANYPAYTGGGGAYFAEGDIDKSEEASSLLMKYWQRGFTATLQAFEAHYSGIAQPRQVNNFNDLVYKGLLVSTVRRLQFDDINVKVFADYNRFYPEFFVTDFPSSGIQGGFRMAENGRSNYRTRIGGDMFWALSSEWDWFVGAEWERRSTGEYQVYNYDADTSLGSIMPKFSLQEKALYSQMDYRPDVINWRFTLGGRYTNNSITGSDTVPKLSAVYQLSPQSSLKALYSVGFNSPSFTQLKADFGGLVVGNPDLTPENVETYDLAYSYSDDRTLFVVNIYQLSTENFIASDRANGIVSFFNTGGFTRYGGEVDWQYQVSDSVKLLSNFSYYYQGGEERGDDPTLVFSPEFTVNIGAEYQFSQAQRIGTSIRYMDERSSASSLLRWNLEYQYRWDQVSLSASFENILDESIRHPNMGEFNDRLVPAGQGRNLKLGLRYRW